MANFHIKCGCGRNEIVSEEYPGVDWNEDTTGTCNSCGRSLNFLGHGRPANQSIVWAGEYAKEGLLPDWAVYALSPGDGYMHHGAQLCTKDGRRMGNAFIYSICERDGLGKIANCFTDMGNTFRFTESELKEFFHEPMWVMDVIEAIRVRNIHLEDD